MSRRADLPLAVSAVIVLQLLNLVAVPLWAGQVVSSASLSAVMILKDLLELVTIPSAKLFVRAVPAAGNITHEEGVCHG